MRPKLDKGPGSWFLAWDSTSGGDGPRSFKETGAGSVMVWVATGAMVKLVSVIGDGGDLVLLDTGSVDIAIAGVLISLPKSILI